MLSLPIRFNLQPKIHTIAFKTWIKKLTLLVATTLIAIAGLAIATIQSALALSWTWHYTGAGITASGTFITNDTPNELGFYRICAITGMRNGQPITRLQPPGIPIPGNEPFSVDNLISLQNPQLTAHGFGYSTAEGNFSSPFFANFLPTPSYVEVLSAPPLTRGFEHLGTEDSESPISFSATPR